MALAALPQNGFKRLSEKRVRETCILSPQSFDKVPVRLEVQDDLSHGVGVVAGSKKGAVTTLRWASRMMMPTDSMLYSILDCPEYGAVGAALAVGLLRFRGARCASRPKRARRYPSRQRAFRHTAEHEGALQPVFSSIASNSITVAMN